MPDISIRAYPWDLHDIGQAEPTDRMRAAG